MIKEEMKVGPKGQVVIPKIFRKAFGIAPGSKVIFELREEGILIEKPNAEIEKIAERIARSGKPAKKIDIHGIYEEIEERWKGCSQLPTAKAGGHEPTS